MSRWAAFLSFFPCVALSPSLLAQSALNKRLAPAPEYTFKVVHAFPHDRTAFTQGLAFREGFLYEGTGLKGQSSLRKVKLETGKVLGWIDLTGLLSPMYRRDGGAVLNGIAYDSARKRLCLTGKLWPTVFEIRIIPKPRQ